MARCRCSGRAWPRPRTPTDSATRRPRRARRWPSTAGYARTRWVKNQAKELAVWHQDKQP